MLRSKSRPRLMIACLLIALFYASPSLWAQSRNMTKTILVFEDGRKLTGYGKLSSDKIKFKLESERKKVRYSFDSLEYAMVYDSNGSKAKKYKKLKIKGDWKSAVVYEVIKGKVSLYKRSVIGYNPGFGPGGIGGISGEFSYAGGSYDITNLYLMREGEEELTSIGSNQLFSKNFKRGASEYFSDCKDLAVKIRTKKYKKKDIIKIVDDYNKNCN